MTHLTHLQRNGILLLSFLLTFIVPTATQAQDVDYGLGVQGGLLLSGASFDGADGAIGFSAGGFYRLDIGVERLYVQPEAMFTLKGFDTDLGPLGELNSRTFGVEVPVLAGYSIAALGDGAISALAGPYLSVFGTNDDLSGDEVDNFSLGIQAGAAYDINQWVFSLRYDTTIGGISDSPDGADDLNINSFRILAGYKF